MRLAQPPATSAATPGASGPPGWELVSSASSAMIGPIRSERRSRTASNGASGSVGSAAASSAPSRGRSARKRSPTRRSARWASRCSRPRVSAIILACASRWSRSSPTSHSHRSTPSRQARQRSSCCRFPRPSNAMASSAALESACASRSKAVGRWAASPARRTWVLMLASRAMSASSARPPRSRRAGVIRCGSPCACTVTPGERLSDRVKYQQSVMPSATGCRSAAQPTPGDPVSCRGPRPEFEHDPFAAGRLGGLGVGDASRGRGLRVRGFGAGFGAGFGNERDDQLMGVWPVGTVGD